MNIENLIVGQEYKYKELCEILGIEPTKKANNQRNAQFKELATKVDFELVGKGKGAKYLIKEIYTMAKEKEDKRKIVKENDKRRLGNNNELSTHIQYSLVCLLNKKPEPTEVRGIGLNRFQLYLDLGMSNQHFGNAFINKKGHADSIVASEQAVIECFDYTYQRLYARLDSAFESYMKKSSGFTITKGYRFVLDDGKYQVADKIEEGIIADVEDLVLQEFGVRNKRDLIFTKKDENNKYPEFKTRVIAKLKEEFPMHFEGLMAYSDSFIFAFTKRAIARVKARMEKEYGFNEETIREELNKLLLSSLDKTIEGRHQKTVEKYSGGWGEQFIPKIEEYRMKDTYIDEQKRVRDSIIKIKADKNKKENEDIPF